MRSSVLLSMVATVLFACSSGGSGHPGFGDMAGQNHDLHTSLFHPDLSGGGGCTNGEVMCETGCTDVTIDPKNCGFCNNACAQGVACSNSQCGTSNCGFGQKMCSGVCTDVTSDPSNCGNCNVVCPSGTCTSGQCVTNNATYGCNGCVMCLNNCTDQTCQNNCLNNTTPTGKSLFNAVLQCVQTACPTMNGGICDSTAANYDANACNSCINTAVMGSCSSQWNACTASTP